MENVEISEGSKSKLKKVEVDSRERICSYNSK